MTKTFSFTPKKNNTSNNNSKFFLNNGYTNYSKIIDDIILADITKKNSYMFGDNNYNYKKIDDDPIILTGSKLKYDDDFIKAANFLANYKSYKKIYKIPYELNKMYTLSDGTRIVFYDDEIQIGSLFYKYSDFNNLAFLNTISEPTKKIIINININLY